MVGPALTGHGEPGRTRTSASTGADSTGTGTARQEPGGLSSAPPPGRLQPGRDGRRETAPRPRPLLRTMIGDVLRRTRIAQGRTLADVSRAARVSVPYLSEVERGRKEASSEVLAAVCDALRLDLSDLLAGVARDLAAGQAGRAGIIRLDTARLDLARRGTAGGRTLGPRQPGSMDAQLLAA